MKKFIAMLSTVVLCYTYMPMCVEAVNDIEITSTDITIENNPELWKRFLKYDIGISDYNSLTDEEKEVCKFIFETEQSTTETIRCERARRILAHDENISERLTIDTLENPDFFGICDKYNADFNFGKQRFMHCVPDIIHMDYDFMYEYWLDDNGDTQIITDMYGASANLKMLNDAENLKYLGSLVDYSIIEDSINGKEYLCIDKNFAKELDEEKLIESGGNTYYLCSDNTLTLIASKYQNSSYLSAPVEEIVIIPEEVNGYPVTAIEHEVFFNTTITKVILPETIEFINQRAFFNCQFLEEINFPESLKYIGNGAFNYTSLKEIKINSPELVIAREAFSEATAVNVEINAKIIGEYAFAGCHNLENIELSENIKEIHSRAFWGNNLTHIILPENLKYIGVEAFYSLSEDSQPKTITIPESVEVIGTLPLSRGIFVGSSTYPSLNSLLQEYECAFPNNTIISGYYGTEAHNFSLAHNLTFRPLDDLNYGDANNDGNVNIADAVSLQKYLFGNGSVGYEADLTKDGIIDSFDMIPMRKMILNNK